MKAIAQARYKPGAPTCAARNLPAKAQTANPAMLTPANPMLPRNKKCERPEGSGPPSATLCDFGEGHFNLDQTLSDLSLLTRP